MNDEESEIQLQVRNINAVYQQANTNENQEYSASAFTQDSSEDDIVEE